MNFPIVREYKTDILNTHPDNEQRGEPFKVKAGKFSRIIIPTHAPFFVSSLKMYFPNGEPMKYGEDFRIYRLMPRLTDTASEPIACMIELMKDEITEGTIDYDVIGHFSLFDSTLMSLIRNAVDDDRPVWWENVFNKPTVFRPKLHPHSLIYDVVAFQDFIEVLDLIVYLSDSQGQPIVEMKIARYFDTFIYRLNLYREMLKKLIQSHASTKNEHGLTATQVGLEKVDNFATAVGAQLLENRTDLHLTVQGLQVIIDRFGFNETEFLKADNMPISQFGNTNFIPPNISGSFEGFGGVTETGAICLEGDGSLTFLWNRMDGRTRGLYYSVMTDSADFAKAKLTYTGFKYEHPRFVQDNVNVDRIAQGSGSEVILVGDSSKNLFYVGVTNTSLSPAKHVYSKINLQPLVDLVFTPASNVKPISLFPFISVMLMGEWIYIIQSAINLEGGGVGSDMPIRFFFRVRLADVQATIDVTPVIQNLTYVDADGVQRNNVPYYRWYTTTIDPASKRPTKSLFTFSPLLPNGHIGSYRSFIHYSAEDPARPGIYAFKFISAYYSSYNENGISNQFNFVPEINYDFNPTTGVFSLTSKSDIPPAIDFRNVNPIPPGYELNIQPLFGMVFAYAGQGGNILDDGRVIASGAQGFSGFPRLGNMIKIANSKTRHATVSKKWSPGFNEFASYTSIGETIVSPLESSTDVKAVMYRPGAEFYVAAGKTESTTLKAFWKEVSGKFALRPEVSNLFVNNIQSRPLTNNIRSVNVLPGIGGVTVSVPSSQLDTYGIEVGESSFCMSAQSKHFRYYEQGTGWKAPQVGGDDILLVSTFDKRIEADNTVTIIPTLETVYPAAIVNQFKALVEFPAIAANGRECIVTVSDPTFSSLGRFGWLPVTVAVTYVNAQGTPNQNNQYVTYMTIEPTYVDNADGRKQVTGFTVLDKVNYTLENTAIESSVGIRLYNGRLTSPESPQSTLGPMRTFYYLEGNKLTCHLNSGVIGQTTGDAFTVNLNFSYNDRTTKRWTSVANQQNSSAGGGVFITPDNGIATMYPMASVSGGAATIVNGPVSKCLVGSLYPEVGWAVFFQTSIDVTFNGRKYNIPSGVIDLRDVDPSPTNKTFYIYACLDNGRAYYEISLDKRLESAFQLWIGRLVTNDRQIITIDRYNVMAVNGHRVSETKRGSSIPATSGLVNAEGQIPWIRQDELLP